MYFTQPISYGHHHSERCLMIWKIAVLTVALMGCSERPIDTPNTPPIPPGADLWPLGGKIYHGTPLQDAPSTDPALDDTASQLPAGADTDPASDAAASAPAPAAPAEDAPPEAATTAEPAEAPTAEPAEAPTAEPAEAPTAEPAEASTAEPAEASTAEPAENP